MKKKLAIGGLLVLFVALLTGALFIVFMNVSAKNEEPVEVKDITMFSSITGREQFQEIPKMVCENAIYSEPEDYGTGDWVMNVTGSTTEEYKEYLKLLERNGFKKHSDNGEDAMEGYVHTASFTKGELTYTVSHAIREDHTYLVASFTEELSPHLIYQDSYMDGVTPGAKTKVHMLELHNVGNSFIIQLKNGHFVVYDGGTDKDAPYLLDYLEDLTPGDEIPIVEGWFFSHGHWDHTGALNTISMKDYNINRIYLRGVYFTEPTMDLTSTLNANYDGEVYPTTKIHNLFKDENGNKTKFYRMHLGQRYYFCDIKIDVALTLEQMVREAYYETDFNDTSTWLMAHIDGQKFLCAGDTHHTGMREAMKMYEKEYFDLDVFAVFHHGINVWDYWTDYCSLKTVLYTVWREGSIWNPVTDPILGAGDRNTHLKASCKEYVSHGNGTVVLTFPYTVGTYEVMAPCKWQYDNGVKGAKESSSGTQQ